MLTIQAITLGYRLMYMNRDSEAGGRALFSQDGRQETCATPEFPGMAGCSLPVMRANSSESGDPTIGAQASIAFALGKTGRMIASGDGMASG